MGNNAYKKEQRITGRITGLGTNVAFVTLQDGTRGVIRQRELSWDRAIRHPDELLSRGQMVEAVVIGRDPQSGRLELSLRRAQHDPWDEFVARTERDQVVRGTVTQVMPYGAFVEIQSGIVGLVHISEIAPWRVDQVEDVLWVGDQVEAVILRVERERRRVALSIRARLEQLSPAETRPPDAEEVPFLSTPQAEVHIHGPISQPVHKIRAVLVADDERGLREAMRGRMRRRGYQVSAVGSGEAAVRLASERRFDVVFIDVNFSQGIDGVQAARRIAEVRPGTAIIFMTGVELTDDQIRAIHDLKSAALLFKPLRREDMDEILAQVEGEQLAPLEIRSRAIETPILTQVGGAGERRSPLNQQLARDLEAICQQTGATAALFHLDPHGREVELLARCGKLPMDFDRARHNLADSPVGDVILGGEVILENDVKGRALTKFRYLLTLLNFGSCIGVPVSVWGETQHALFLFHSDAEHFSSFDQERAFATAARLSATLERSRLDEVMEAFQRQSLQGQLTYALAHEVNNKLSTVELDLDGVLQDFNDLARHPSSSERWTEIGQALERLSRITRQTLNTVSIFQRLMRGDEPRALDVNRIVSGVVEQLRPLGRRHGVRLRLELSPRLPPCWGMAPRLHQACLNITLNAIQQIRFKTATGGLVSVRTTYEPADKQPIKIRFSDDGPGIHRRDFERVFEMGYTTRGGEGTGLGLYVTRGLIEAMGGKVSVAESYMLVGTTFLIKLSEATL
jgi:signal transduction histidine kinase